MRIETAHPTELGSGEIAQWRAHQRENAALRSPYFAPDWAVIVGAARKDARVCVIEDGRGFFGAQRLSSFAAMGLGAPIADYQGVVGEAGLEVSARALCRALKVGRIDLTHVPAGQSILSQGAGAREGSWIAETGGARTTYEAGLRARRAEFVRQTDKKLRKLEREAGPVRFAVETDGEAFTTLLAWKRAQLKGSGQPAIWDTPWVRQVIETCFARTDVEALSGVLFTMRVDGRLAAASFCLRSTHALHMWIIGHDEAFEAHSPGVQLARWVIGWAGDNAIAEVDFGPGEYRYKRQLATAERAIMHGVAATTSWSGAIRRGEYALRARIERMPEPRLAALPGKAMRKLDLIRALAA